MRQGVTLVETMVLTGVVATLVGIVLPTVEQAHEAALKVEGLNNLREMGQAAHGFASAHDGWLPSISGAGADDPRDSLFFALLAYVKDDGYYQEVASGKSPHSSEHTVKIYVSPADPTIDRKRAPGLASYAANAVAFQSRPNLKQIPDGAAHTIFFAEHYAWVKRNGEQWQYNWAFGDDYLSVVQHNGVTITARRASFADKILGDVHPITNGNPPESIGSDQGLTFQCKPDLAQFDPRLAQSPHADGMLIGLADGSARLLGKGVAPEIYWGALTPNAGGKIRLPE